MWFARRLPAIDDNQGNEEVEGCWDESKVQFHLFYHLVGTAEGTQIGIQNFKNAMCEVDPEDQLNANKARPKESHAMLSFLDKLLKMEEGRQAVIDYKVQEALSALGIKELKKVSGEVINIPLPHGEIPEETKEQKS
jgi:hypothetical protein